MNHTVLARKWRPKKFSDLVGQQSTVTILQNIITTKRIHHAYLLTGTRGVGKTTIARVIAKALNCIEPQAYEPCGKCQNCQEIDNGRFIDVIEIDAASNTGVDNIREVIENAQYAPTSGRYKIYIIDEVHMLSKSAFNAMLKTLEEPPNHVVFILATTDPQKVPITILSRCLQLKLRNLIAAEITEHLVWIFKQEKIEAERDALEVIAHAANGSMRDALSLSDQVIAFANGSITHDMVRQMLGVSDDSSIIALLKSVNQQDSTGLISLCQRLNQEGCNLENILSQVNRTLFQIALAQLTPQPNFKPELLALAKEISVQDCQLYFEISNLALEQISKMTDKYPVFVMSLLRMLAFRIGSQEQKQLLVNNTNFNSDTTQSITEANEISNTKLASPVTIKPQLEQNLNQDLQDNQNSKLQKLITSPQISAPADKEPQQSPQLAPWEETTVTKDSVMPVIEEQKATCLQTKSIDNPSQATTKVFTGDWIGFVKQIDFSQIKEQSVALVLRNSELNSYEEHRLKLVISDTYISLVTAECVDTIEKILYDIYHTHFDLEFDFVTSTASSYKDHQISETKQRQINAEEAINNDPIIQDLINNFSAKITPNSIKPLE